MGETNGIVAEVGVTKEGEILFWKERARKGGENEVKEEKEMDPEEQKRTHSSVAYRKPGRGRDF